MGDEASDSRLVPGWKKDPYGRFYARYWDGARWTEHVASEDRVQLVDPIPAPPPPPPIEVAPPPPPRTAPRPRPAPVAAPPVMRSPETRPPKGRGRRKIPLWAKIGVPLVVVIAVAASAGSDDKKDTHVAATGDTTAEGAVSATTKAATTKPPTKSSYAVGDTARTSDFDITVYGFKDPATTTNQFDKAKAGMHYVAVDVQVANRDTKQQRFSSLIGFHIVDGANRQYDLAITTIAPGAPDGEIPPGEAIRGFAVFEVPDGATGLRLRVQGSFTASGAFFSLL